MEASRRSTLVHYDPCLPIILFEGLVLKSLFQQATPFAVAIGIADLTPFGMYVYPRTSISQGGGENRVISTDIPPC